MSWNFQFLWTDSQLWINVVILFAHCVVSVLYLSFVERRRMRRSLFHLWSAHATSPPPKDQKDEASILNEEMFVAQTKAKVHDDEDVAFIVEKLSTTSGRRVLLQDITFAAEPGKCTTIVGPQTSGITVLYEILAGMRAISEGKVGCCPSNDITVDKLNGLQLLNLFGRLRGIPSKDLRTHVDHWVQTFGLQKVIKKPCQSYSSVIKKKLAVAMACIGNPPVVIFDDPTSGLDPLSKAQVCGVIEKLVWTNRIVIVLTHDVSSIQWDCYKLIFLVNGQMQYCENPDTLALEIAHEFTLIIKLKADGTERVDFETYTEFKSQLEKEIEEMLLFDEQVYCLKYRIQSKKYDWLTLFEVVEKNIKSYPFVEDYFIRKTSLEDVYHSYAVKQRVIRKADSVWDQFRSTYC